MDILAVGVESSCRSRGHLTSEIRDLISSTQALQSVWPHPRISGSRVDVS